MNYPVFTSLQLCAKCGQDRTLKHLTNGRVLSDVCVCTVVSLSLPFCFCFVSSV